MTAVMAVPTISVIIPVLGVPGTLAGVLASLAEGAPREIILASGDGSEQVLAKRFEGTIAIQAPRGRGMQLAAGAAAARGDWLLFLHADSCLECGWPQEVLAFLGNPGNRGRAAAFRLAFDDCSGGARRVAALANWRSRVLGLPYGDQGLLIAKAFYDELGGFEPLPLMEDVAFVRRIGRHRMALLNKHAVTSAMRYRREGWWLRPLRNLGILALYFLGVPPARLQWLYG